MSETPLESCFGDFAVRDWETVAVDRTVDLAVVGLGQFARDRALPAIEDASLCRATVLVSGSPAKAERLAGAYDVDHVVPYDEFQEGRAADAFDAVYIATPNAYHAPYTEAAAALGKHVLCEKPLATDVGEAERMIDACEAADVTLMTAYRLQTEPAVRRTREIVEAGVIGDPIHVSGWFAHRLPDEPRSDEGWRRDRAIAGGGAMLDLGVYPLNTARFLLGTEPTAASATTTQYDTEDEDTEPVEKRATFQLEFPDGVVSAGLAGFDMYPDNRLQVLGTEGRALIVSPFGGVVSQAVLVDRGDARTSYEGPPVDEVVEEFDYFAYCVLTGTEPEPDGEDGLADLRAIRAIYESAERGERIPV